MNNDFYNNLLTILTSGNMTYTTTDIIQVAYNLGIITQTEYTNLMRIIYGGR